MTSTTAVYTACPHATLALRNALERQRHRSAVVAEMNHWRRHRPPANTPITLPQPPHYRRTPP